MTHVWRVGAGREITLDRPRLIAILNVTPDSFSDGGRHADPERALQFALGCIDEGADVIDVGGESTRPGAQRVTASEQIARVIPVISRLTCQTKVSISIDTTRAAVAQAALDAGAHIINDVSAGTEDAALFSLAARHCAGLILMHRLRPPGEDSYSDRYADPPRYDDVLAEVKRFLLDRAAAAESAGVRCESIVIDPGLGFGKTVDQNFQLIRRTAKLVDTPYPVLAAASRKSFIGKVTGVDDPAQRLAGTLAVSVIQYLAGVRLFRVHDLAAHREALAAAAAALAEPAPRHST